MVPLRALLIDFDGTLADHESVFAEALDGFLGLPGLEVFRLWLEVHREVVHRHHPERHDDPEFHLSRMVRRRVSPDDAARFRQRFREGARRSSANPRFHRDALEFLNFRAGPLRALSTGDRSRAKAEAVRQALGHQPFDRILSEEQVGVRKDRPEFFRRATARLDLHAREVAYLGDLPLHDIGPARSAGLWTVYVNRRGEPIPPGYPRPNFEVRNLREARRALGLV